MANRFISVKDPSTTEFQLGSGGASGNSNMHDGTSTTAGDLVELRWDSTVSRKGVFDAMMLIKRFILQGGFGQPGSDGNIPV
jgi:hypothetical protein